MLNFPNIISMTRVIISPFFLFMFLSKDNRLIRIACYLFLLGAITDYFDGWFARKYRATTKLGAFFDPLADKVLTTCAFIAFASLDIIPYWMVLVILFRDIGTTILRIFADYSNNNLKTSNSAKLKTALQMIFISVILAFFFIKSYYISTNDIKYFDTLIYSKYTYFSMLGITILTIWTILEYFYYNKSLIIHFLSYITRNKFANE